MFSINHTHLIPSVVKTVFENDVRRFSLESVDYTTFVATIRQLYPDLSVADFSVKFRDEDGDLITISSTAELAAALTSSNEQGLKALKLLLTRGGSPAADFVEVAAPSLSPPVSPGPTSPKQASPLSPLSESRNVAPETPKVQAEPVVEAKLPESEHKPEDGEQHGCFRYKRLLKHMLRDAQVQAALPDVVKAVLAVVVPEGERTPFTAQQVVDALLSVPVIKQHSSVQALLPLLPTALPRLERWAAVANEHLANLDASTWALVKSLVPLAPALAAQLGPYLPMVIKCAFRLRRMMKHEGGFGPSFPGCPAGRGHWWSTHRFPHEHVSVMSEQAVCDVCKATPLSGTRYKCFRCRVILCEGCEAANKHPSGHALLKVRPEAIKPAAPKDVHENVQCDGCGVLPIQGVRYKCTVCHDYDLCGSCEAKNDHAAEHPLIKMREVRQHHFPHFGGFARHGGMMGRCGRRFAGSAPVASASPAEAVEEKQQQPVQVVTPAVPAATPTPVLESKAATPAPAPPKYEAAFLSDVNIPDGTVVSAGAELVKIWELRNTGDVAWPAGTKLIFLRGDRELSAQEEFLVPAAGPGQSAEATAVIVAPRNAGRYTAHFRLADSSRQVVFGPRIWVDVVVPEDAKPVPAAKPAVTEKPAEVAKSSKFAEQMKVLLDMGFHNTELNEYLLTSHDGNVQKVAHFLLEKMYGGQR